ncbi:zinc-binding domain-containing protein, partial [Dactylonectria estremocensis]
MSQSNSWKWSMYPKLHTNVSRLLKEDGLQFEFHGIDDDKTCIEKYDTNVMGRFTCNNHKCSSNGWPSMKIAITIRMYPGNRYNARVYSQRCRACNTPSRPFLDKKSYADRVAYRIKKWNGVDVDPPHYSGDPRGDHEKDLCEGCRAGHCSQR